MICQDKECKNRLDRPLNTLIAIKWVDASYQRGECYINELNPLIEIHSFGLLINETDEIYSIAIDFYPIQCTFRHICHIPKVNVTKVSRVELPMDFF